jgi:diguanylate cyclase (GGDEF)-like protein/PAS domain S-box-containing protein
MGGQTTSAGIARRAAWLVGLVMAWIAAAHLAGGDLVVAESSPWFAPAAVTVVAGVAFGWWAIVVALAAATIDMAIVGTFGEPGGTQAVAIVTAVAHAVSFGAAGTWLRRRGVDVRDTGMRDLLRLVTAAAVVAPLAVGLARAAAMRVFTDHAGGTTVAGDAFTWASRDAVAVICAASLPFALHGAWRDRRPLRRAVISVNPHLDRSIAVVQLALAATSVAAAFSLGDPASPPIYLAVPALLWLAATRGHRFAAFGVSLLGAGLWLSHTVGTPVPDATSLRLQLAGTALLTLAVGAQVDDRRRAAVAFGRINLALRMSEARYRAVIENAADGFLVLGTDGVVEMANGAIERMFGRDRSELEGELLTHLLPPPVGTSSDDHLIALLEGSGSGADRYWLARRADGNDFPVRVALSRVDVDGRVTYTAIVADESDRKQFEDLLEHQATHDHLTDLPNRALFHERLLAELERLRRNPGTLALLLVDLDKFKAVNDTLGHTVGDRVLQETAHRLRDSVRRGDMVARLGGDEFAVLIGPSVDGRSAEATAARAIERLGAPFDGVPPELSPSASVGIRLVTHPDDDPVDIVRQADAALYQAKRAGRSTFRFFSGVGPAPAAPEEIDLRDRITDGSVVVRYQPVIDAASGSVWTVEALARIARPDGSLVPPSEFIPLAERSGLIDRLGELVLRRALMDLYGLRQALGRDDLSVSVNVSPRQLGNHRLPSIIEDALATAGLGPDALMLEITETMALGDVPGAAEMARTIRARGVRIVLDDFGSGRTNLSALREVPADALKIDRSYVAGIVDDDVDRDIVASIVSLAAARGIVAVAEGVESVDLVDELGKLGCTHLQGFLFGRPATIGELTTVLHQWSAVPVLATRRPAVYPSTAAAKARISRAASGPAGV